MAMRRYAVGIGVGAVAYFLLFRFAIKTGPDDQGFVNFSEGFGLDDLILGGGAFLAGCMAADMVK